MKQLTPFLLLFLLAGCGNVSADSQIFEAAATAIEAGDLSALQPLMDTRVQASNAEIMVSLDEQTRAALASGLRNATFVKKSEGYSEYKIHLDDVQGAVTDLSVFVVDVDGTQKLRFE